ncbi:MAG: putative iron-regulated protein [Polaromonas sp.]|nr:putative iron-regulated protein [Polaromonas sp.]
MLAVPRPPRTFLHLSALAVSLLAGLVVFAAGCAAQPEPPVLRPLDPGIASATAARIDPLLPTEVLILGEQHDAQQHQEIEQQVVALLASRGVLAALVLEMADTGASTASLRSSSTEQQVQSALKWDDRGWPWAAYGPAVMTAVRAGVPVLGGNLPRGKVQASMADAAFDVQLPGPALKAQQQLIRSGHCNLLPESQITPMTRVQVARDISMAAALAQAVLPGKVVVLLSGNGHADRTLGVPQHLQAGISSRSLRLLAGGAAADAGAQAGAFDAVWRTAALPDTDYCEQFRRQTGR